MSQRGLRILITVLVLGAGLVVGLVLVRQRQLFGKKAAVQGGTAQVRLVPGSKTVGVGGTFGVEVRFTPGTEPISAITVQLDYSYQGPQPPLTVTSVDANPQLLGTGEWSVPIKTVTTSGGLSRVRIAAINTSLSGFSSANEEMLATLNFRGDVPGTINVTFNAVESKVFTKPGVDVLTDPTGVAGTYTVGAVSTLTPTPTPTPTVIPNVPFSFKVRLQGITTKAGDQTATVTFKQGGQEVKRVTGVQLVNDVNGVYFGNVPESVQAGVYDVLVKTGSHLQKKYYGLGISPVVVVDLSLDMANQLKLADVNNTNTLTVEDIALILTKYVDFSVPVPAGTPEDVNADGEITIEDIALSLVNYTDFTIAGDN